MSTLLEERNVENAILKIYKKWEKLKKKKKKVQEVGTSHQKLPFLYIKRIKLKIKIIGYKYNSYCYNYFIYI